ncbi:hypothetical protein Bbelb_095160 [Branchiostoma belcheri]|nr:hypothetical protein Bbelb_095160 [Branchiostoma belcheri]
MEAKQFADGKRTIGHMANHTGMPSGRPGIFSQPLGLFHKSVPDHAMEERGPVTNYAKGDLNNDDMDKITHLSNGPNCRSVEYSLTTVKAELILSDNSGFGGVTNHRAHVPRRQPGAGMTCPPPPCGPARGSVLASTRHRGPRIAGKIVEICRNEAIRGARRVARSHQTPGPGVEKGFAGLSRDQLFVKNARRLTRRKMRQIPAKTVSPSPSYSSNGVLRRSSCALRGSVRRLLTSPSPPLPPTASRRGSAASSGICRQQAVPYISSPFRDVWSALQF